MRKVIFVGDKASSKMKKGAKPFDGAACEKRLNEWIVYLMGNRSTFDYYVYNQCDLSYPNFLYLNVMCGYTFVALGNNASKKLDDIPHYKLPHPSGKNLQLNDKELLKKKLKACKKYITSR